jgi:tetratricopeptide (TPR) repeat protein/transcriptional regulator with XRE-family HTH domain
VQKNGDNAGNLFAALYKEVRDFEKGVTLLLWGCLLFRSIKETGKSVNGKLKDLRIVKNITKKQTNQLLRTERELRGWSQKYVAEQLGADHYYLSRWERGTAVPSPYYRQKLCALFGKNARELGLLREEMLLPNSSSHLEQEITSTDALQREETPIYDPSLPLFVAEETGLVGRDDLVKQMKERLCIEQVTRSIALTGLPGAGKTTLAAALAQDSALRQHFADGILWAGLGPNPDLISHLSRWGMLLGLPTAESSKLTTVEEWIKAVHLLIGSRRMLLMIDDAWRVEAALSLQVGGPHCAHLLTSRLPLVVLQFAPNATLTVPELSPESGLTLLSRLIPDVVEREPETARHLVEAASGLPLALTIMGKYLRRESYSRQPRRIGAALKRLLNARERLLLTLPQSALEPSSNLSIGVPLSLHTVIAVGERGLSRSAQEALRALSVFPAKPNSMTEEAALAVSGANGETLDELTDSGLLEGCEYGRYCMHQLIADYARTHVPVRSASQRFLLYMINNAVLHRKDHEKLAQEQENIAVALQEAWQENHLAEYVCGVNAFAPFLLVRGQFPKAQTYLLRAEQAARTLASSSVLATTLLYLGKVHYHQGDLEQAARVLDEGLAIARQYDHSECLCLLLDTLGIIARASGSYQLAEQYHQEGLLLARTQGEQELICVLLKSLGIDLGEQGHYQEEARCYQEGILLARQAGDTERLAELLINLGQATFACGDYAQAMDHSREALQICRQMGYRHAMTTLLADLGGMATDQKDYAQGEIYLREALSLARQMEHRHLIGVSLVNLGATVLELGDDQQAESYLQEALHIARQIKRQWLLCGVLHGIGDLYLKREQFAQALEMFQELQTLVSQENREYQAVALYGLARGKLGLGDLAEARKLGQESVHLFQKMKNRQLPEVKAWLEQIS